jgi:LVIVD repeat-containing protein
VSTSRTPDRREPVWGGRTTPRSFRVWRKDVALNSTGNNAAALARNVRRLGHLDLAGAGQVTLKGRYAYVGHTPNGAHLGTTILDVSDPAHPRSVATIMLTDTTSHSHKVRVVGDLMIVNHERNPTAIGRRAEELPRVRRQLADVLGRAPTHAEWHRS